ncbi:hypothetical protein SAMN02799630_00985 [Paenibacillus sp. UNCCL117]|uniref:CbrC family protein n=1 Tax=unclassified Paenibacillus TaxID=185978 RepID=UPI0008833596|nr:MULTISPECIES: CbrC family protein [unclassified Paenibacillus]SDC27559.1 hypothetical protein SAMN04488602_101787 [Paenibacillus sp. cl123]SFW20354.1 hypothetical protein SAMN02799630_00985 [Paenibacillus sp. UNCCL117]
MNFPKFKYNADPIKLKVIVQRKTCCPVCNKERDYAYQGPFYTTAAVEGICPWCIADGSAARKYDGDFQDIASCERVDSPGFLDELIHRTPGFCGWQQEHWLSCCGDFCAITDYMGWKQIQQLVEEFPEQTRADFEQLLKDYRISEHEFKTASYDHIQGYLFKCMHCNNLRFYTDCD